MATDIPTMQDLFRERFQGDHDSDLDFEFDSLPGSPVSSAGCESVIADDLDLYENGCVCQSKIETHGLKGEPT